MQAKETIRYATGALGAILLLTVAGGASAGPIRIDFGPSPEVGEIWTAAGGINWTQTPVATGALPFNMFIGSTTYTNYCVIEGGTIWFTNAPNTCGTDPSGAVFDVLGANWEATDADPLNGINAPNPGVVSASAGLVDREEPFNASEITTQVMRFLWNGVLLAGDDTFTEYYIQAVFFDLGAGDDFDLEFSYGTTGNPASYDIPGGTQSIVEGGVPLYTGLAPFVSSTDYVFSFVGGALVDGPSTSVPEPSTWLLFSGTLLGFAFARRRAELRNASASGAPA